MQRAFVALRIGGRIRDGLAVAAVAGLLVAPSAARAVGGGTFTVDTLDDTGDSSVGDGICDIGDKLNSCSLRAAIQEANELGGFNTIEFDASLDASAITLDSSQLPAITGNLTIAGNGESNTIVQASICDPIPVMSLTELCVPADFRVLEIAEGATVLLSGLTIQNGLCADSCGPNGPSYGAGILNSGTLTLENVTLSHNYAKDGENQSRGGGLFNLGSIPAITGSTFTHNQADNSGGGLYNEDPGTIGNVLHTGFDNNYSSSGGGLYNYGRVDLVAFSTFDNNTAGSGGGLYADGTNDMVALIADSTFTSNEATDYGGAIYSDSGTLGDIERCTFVHNTSATDGGAIHVNDHDAGLIANCTFFENGAAHDGGAISFSSASSVSDGVRGSTFHGNVAVNGSAINAANSLTVGASLFGGGTQPPPLVGGVFECLGTADAGGNLDDDTSCGGGGGITPDVDYATVLADNGGSTQTLALPPSSDAVDALGTCPPQLGGIDQRGLPRSDSQCDVGAYERGGNLIFADDFPTGTTGAWSSTTP